MLYQLITGGIVTAQVVLIINFFIMLNLALTTLPLYTLAVLLGSDFGDTHERHQPLAERLHKLFMRHSREQVCVLLQCMLSTDAFRCDLWLLLLIGRRVCIFRVRST